jgi:hypothetical protein
MERMEHFFENRPDRFALVAMIVMSAIAASVLLLGNVIGSWLGLNP